jgi:S1-C subfamily serine protease
MPVCFKLRTAPLLLSLLVVLANVEVFSQELPSLQQSTRKLQATVVTVRVTQAMGVETRLQQQPARKTAPTLKKVTPTTTKKRAVTASGTSRQLKPVNAKVTVCTGICLADGLIVTSLDVTANSSIRITYPGGEQSTARPRVIDEYSGLVLLQTKSLSRTGLQLASEVPETGEWVVSAASWGAEKPVISVGIVSSTGRALAGTRYPPLLQCDLRSVQTSSGAALVNRSGDLVGVVVLTDANNNRQGWTYAVPAQHVKRLVKSLASRQNKDEILILKRRRPVVGMVLGGNADNIAVIRIEKDGPAARAGIQVGDRILATDGIKIRSVYQAIRPVLYKQPGDTMLFTVQNKDRVRQVQVTLGGGVALPASSVNKLSQYVQPKIDLSSRATVQPQLRPHQEVSLPGDDGEITPAPRTSDQKIQLLEKALDRYRRVIIYQQGQLASQRQETLQTDKQLEKLQQEVDALKKQIGQVQPPGPARKPAP